MSSSPTTGSPAPSGLLGSLGSWLRTWSGATGPSSESIAGPSQVPAPHSFGLVRVLVVDDNPVNLMVMSALLEARGIVPLLAADGAEAVTLACELRFDLILMDLQMPNVDGLSATLAIRRFESSDSRTEVPVIAYTSSSPAAAVLASHGMTGILGKPCEDQDLEDCLVRWCPTYCAAPTATGLAPDHSCWQATVRHTGTGSPALR